MSTVIEELQQALSLIQEESHWCQKDYAFDAEGSSVEPQKDEAVRFCALGALHRATGTSCYGPLPDSYRYLKQAAAAIYPISSVIEINDYVGHAAVLALYQEAIRLAQGETNADNS